MQGMPEYQLLNDDLRIIIEKRFSEGWTTVKAKLGYCEATSFITREIVIGNGGKLFGGPDMEATDEKSLATTYGINSDVLGKTHSFIMDSSYSSVPT